MSAAPSNAALDTVATLDKKARRKSTRSPVARYPPRRVVATPSTTFGKNKIMLRNDKAAANRPRCDIPSADRANNICAAHIEGMVARPPKAAGRAYRETT